MIKILAAVAVPSAFPNPIPSGPDGISYVINNLFTFALWVIGVAAVVMVIYAGFMYITSTGRPDKVKTAFQSLLYTAVGFVVVLLARSIVDVILPIAQQPSAPAIVTSGITFFLWVVGAASIIMVVVSGLFYITSSGDPARTKAAKDIILYSVIGLVIALLAGTLVTFIQTQFR